MLGTEAEGRAPNASMGMGLFRSWFYGRGRKGPANTKQTKLSISEENPTKPKVSTAYVFHDEQV